MDPASPPQAPATAGDSWLARGAMLAGLAVVGIGVVLLLRGQDTETPPVGGPGTVARYVPDDWEQPAGLDPAAGQKAPAVRDAGKADGAAPVTPAALDGSGSGEDEWSEPGDLADLPTAAPAPPTPEPAAIEPDVEADAAPDAVPDAVVDALDPDAVDEDAGGPAPVADEGTLPSKPIVQGPTPGAGTAPPPPPSDVAGRPPTTALPGPPDIHPPIVGDAPAAPVVVGDHPGRRLAVGLDVEVPTMLRQGDAADAVLVVRNHGEVRLEGLELGLRGRDGVRVVDSVDGLWTGRVEALDAGATERVTVRIEADTRGSALLLASCREPRGWAAAGATNRVDIVGRAEDIPAAKALARGGPTLALQLSSRAPERIEADQPFELVLTLENTGIVHFRGVLLVLEPADGVRLRGQDQRIEERIESLPAGSRHTLRVSVRPEQPGLRILRASARDERGWAATGAVQFVGVDPVAPPLDPR